MVKGSPAPDGSRGAAAMLGGRIDLLEVDTSAPRPWTRGAAGITRPGLRTIRFGARGSGKSLAELILCVQVVAAGGSAIYVDWENGPRRSAERLAAVLTDRPAEVGAAVRERLAYYPAPRLRALDGPDAQSEWAAVFAGFDLAVIDSTARALGQLDLDENLASDFARFMALYIDPIAAQGTAVDLLDNTGWSDADRTRGSSAKLDMCELAYRVTSSDIAPDRAGEIKLDRVRSRDGDEAAQLVVQVGAGSYSDVHRPEPNEREAAAAGAIVAYLERNPGASTEEVARGVGIRKSDCRSQLGTLETPGTGNGTVYQRRSAYRDRGGRKRERTGWYAASQSDLTTVPDDGTAKDRQPTTPVAGPGPRSLDRDRDRRRSAAAGFEAVDALPAMLREEVAV